MRHLRQVGNDRFAVNVLAERKRDFCVPFRLLPVRRLQKFAQFHRNFPSVCQLDSHCVFSRNRREDVDSLGARCPGKIPLEAHDLIDAHAFRRIHFVPRDGGSFGDVARRHGNAKLRQRID